MKKIIIAALLATTMFPMVASADPAPFGLEIGKATVEEMKEKYSAELVGINQINNGEVYAIEVSGIDFEGLKKVTALFDKDSKLMLVSAVLPKEKFENLLGILSKKYKLSSKEIPFVGDKKAKLVDGNTVILLDAPHLSFTMELNYFNKTFLEKYNAEKDKTKEEAKTKQKSQL